MFHEKKHKKHTWKKDIIESLNRKKLTKKRKNTTILNSMCKVEINRKNNVFAFFELVLGGKLPAHCGI